MACPDCNYKYKVSYTTCYALFNKKELQYLLVKETLLFFACIAVAELMRHASVQLYALQSHELADGWFFVFLSNSVTL